MSQKHNRKKNNRRKDDETFNNEAFPEAWLTDKMKLASPIYLTRAERMRSLEVEKLPIREFDNVLVDPRSQYHLIFEANLRVSSSRSNQSSTCAIATETAREYLTTVLNSLAHHHESYEFRSHIKDVSDYSDTILSTFMCYQSQCDKESSFFYKCLHSRYSSLSRTSLLQDGFVKVVDGTHEAWLTLSTCFLSYKSKLYALSLDQLKAIYESVLALGVTNTAIAMLDGQSLRKGFKDSVNILISKLHNYTFYLKGVDHYLPWKMLNSLCVGRMLIDADNYINSSFYELMIAELANNMGVTTAFLKADLDATFGPMTIPEIAEIMGLAKMFGFGSGHGDETWKKYKGAVENDVEVDDNDIRELRSVIIENLCFRHYTQNRTWPIIENTDQLTPALRSCIMRGRWITDKEIISRYGSSTTDDFYAIKFGKNWSWDPCYNASGLLKDRSTTVGKERSRKLHLLRKQIDEEADPDELLALLGEIKKLQPKMKESKLLAWYLYTSNVNQKLNQSNDLFYSRNWIALFDRLHQKASGKLKEQKIEKMRIFTAMTPEMRHYGSTVQHNAKRMHKFLNPQQVMMATKVDILKTLYSLWSYKSMAPPGSEVYYLDIDVKNWSQSFVSDITSETIGHVFAQWYGVPGLKNFHDMYNQSSITFVEDDENVLYGSDRIPGQMRFFDLGKFLQSGGGQGHFQKWWGDLYRFMCETVGKKLVKVFISKNNGDNLIAAIVVDADARANLTQREYQTWLIENLAEGMMKFGMELKPEECTMSQNVLIMCQNYLVQGRCVGNFLKSIRNAGNLDPDKLDSIENRITNIGSSCHTSMIHSLNPFGVYSVYICMISHLLARMFRMPTCETLLKILCRGSSLGGLPIINFWRFVTNSCSDTLTCELQWLSDMISYGSRKIQIAANYIAGHTPLRKDQKPNLTILRNPMALDIEQPQKAKSKLSSSLLKILSTCNNEAISLCCQLKSIEDSSGSPIMSSLLSMTPYWPRVASQIYAAQDLFSSIVAQFSKSTTVAAIFTAGRRGARAAQKLFKDMMRLDKQFLRWLIKPDEGDIGIQNRICMTEFAKDLRVSCFGPMVDETYPPDQSVVRIIPNDSPIKRLRRAATITYDPADLVDPREIEGHYEPLVKDINTVTYTIEKIDTPLPDIASYNHIYKGATDLVKLYAHIGEESPTLKKYVYDLVMDMTKGSFKPLLDSRITRYSGTVRHRMKVTVLGDNLKISLNLIPSAPVNMRCDLSTAPDTISAGDNSVNFRQALALSQALSTIQLWSRSQHKSEVSYRWYFTDCKHCYRDVSDPKVKISAYQPTPLRYNYLDPSNVEKDYASEAIAEFLSTRKFMDYSNVPQKQLISVARSIVSHALCLGDDRLAAVVMQGEGYHSLSPKDVSTLKKIYGISSAAKNMSLNCIRALPCSYVLKTVISVSLSWILLNRRDSMIDMTEAWVSNVQTDQLPFEKLAADMIESYYCPVFSLLLARLLLPPLSQAESIRVNPLRRKLLSIGSHIVTSYAFHGHYKDLVEEHVWVFSQFESDQVISMKLERRARIFILTRLRYLWGGRNMNLGEFSLYLTALNQLEMMVNRIGNRVRVVQDKGYVALPKKAKNLSEVAKMFTAVVRLTGWWKSYGKIKSATIPRGQIQIIKKEMMSIAQSACVDMSLPDAISIARADPSLEFKSLLSSLKTPMSSFQKTTPTGLAPGKMLECREPKDIIVMHPRSKAFKYRVWDVKDQSTMFPKISDLNRPFGRDVTSINKFLEALDKVGATIEKTTSGCIACVGEGGGVACRGMAELIPGKVVWNTIKIGDESILPSALMDKTVTPRVNVLNSISASTDLTKQATIDYLVEEIGDNVLVFLSCDAESPRKKNRDLELNGEDEEDEDEEYEFDDRQSFYILMNLIELLSRVKCKTVTFLYKISFNDDNLFKMACIVSSCFQRCSLLQLDSSHYFSSEGYFIAQYPFRQDLLFRTCKLGFQAGFSLRLEGSLYDRAMKMVYPFRYYQQKTFNVVNFKKWMFKPLSSTIGWSYESLFKKVTGVFPVPFLRGDSFVNWMAINEENASMFIDSQPFKVRRVKEVLSSILTRASVTMLFNRSHDMSALNLSKLSTYTHFRDEFYDQVKVECDHVNGSQVSKDENKIQILVDQKTGKRSLSLSIDGRDPVEASINNSIDATFRLILRLSAWLRCILKLNDNEDPFMTNKKPSW